MNMNDLKLEPVEREDESGAVPAFRFEADIPERRTHRTERFDGIDVVSI